MSKLHDQHSPRAAGGGGKLDGLDIDKYKDPRKATGTGGFLFFVQIILAFDITAVSYLAIYTSGGENF